jgi:hypothetical protein
VNNVLFGSPQHIAFDKSLVLVLLLLVVSSGIIPVVIVVVIIIKCVIALNWDNFYSREA